MSRHVSALHIAGLTILATHLLTTTAMAQWPIDPTFNVALCTAPGDQTTPAIISDGAGGTITAWTDNRAGNLDIYVQRLSPTGIPLWGVNGVAACTASGDQNGPVLVSDGAGGAIVAWQDSRGANQDIYAQRLNAGGVPQWSTDGNALCTASGNQFSPVIVPDGAGGATVLWLDQRSGTRVFAQRVSSSGFPLWAANGVSLGGQPTGLAAVSDGTGGAIATWKDRRRFGPIDFFIDIYARRINGAGAAQWAVDGVLMGSYSVVNAADLSDAVANPSAITDDGVGGAVIAWTNATISTAGSGDIIAQRVNSTGTVQWIAGGVALCSAAGAQTLPRLVSDGASGAIVAWEDNRGASEDIYARRVNAGGVPLWSADGVALCSAAGAQAAPAIVSDASGGAITAWQDNRGANQDIYAQRISGGGAVQWTVDGLPVCSAVGAQASAAIVSEVTGAPVVAWQDGRGANQDIYAQRITPDGCLGGGTGLFLVSVRDVPNDQGGRVKVSWNASCADLVPPYTIQSYRVWRSSPPNTVQEALTRGARLVRPGDVIAQDEHAVFLATTQGIETYYWELIATQSAARLENYSYVAPTTSDSVAASNPYTAFMIQALLPGGVPWSFSNVDSGYSVDNLSPAAPTAFVAQYFRGSPPLKEQGATASPGYTWLHWSPNSDPDFLEYRLHRGTSSGFIPGPSNLLVAKSDTGYIDIGPAGGYYKLRAVDLHGNLSTVDLLTPADITGVDSPGVGEGLWFGPVRPNPIRDHAVFAFRLPQELEVSLSVFDPRGRLVRQLIKSRLAAGEHAVFWNARDSRGANCGSGVYLTRLVVGRLSFQRKFVLTR